MAELPLRVGLIGCGGMGRGQARLASSLAEYDLVAGCDLSEDALQTFGEAFPGARLYRQVSDLLAQEPLDVVIIATNNISHAPLTLQVAEAGVRGIYCEKPMATNLADAQAMVAACHERGIVLAVNHQRRLLPVFVTLRRLLQEGAIGDVALIRGSCAGDILSDGTHLVDTILYLAGDEPVSWVFGQIHRRPPSPGEPAGMGYPVSGGYRYGHPVENGGWAKFEFASGLRAEIHTGDMQMKGRAYQDYEIFGSQGRFHRPGDSADPNLLIQTDDQAGWRPVPLDLPAGVTDTGSNRAIQFSLQSLARSIHTGAPHPLSGDIALRVQEVVMAVYESARLHQKIVLPLAQPRFPLEIMIEEGAL